MSASVLGKRARSPPCPVESTQRETRSSKRRSIAILGNDENSNPFITRTPTVETEKRPSPASNTNSPATQTRPAKHGASQSRVTPTPNKITSLFSVAKSATSVNIFKDGKATPQTPRHRDALSKKVAVTPRHRIQISNSPATPRTPSTPSNAASNVYNQARQMFARCTDPAVLIGRENEKTQLSTFVSECIDSNHGGCLYISGPPGTGKSAFVGGVCEDFTTSGTVAMSTVNCMSIKSAKDLANTLCDGLDITHESSRGADFDFLRTYFLGEDGTGTNKYIVVLDEIDRLVDLDLKLLYSLFEWSMLPSSNLILIGIANALDLTDRFLPRLKSRELKPDLLPFMPYTAPQIVDILTSKLRSLSTTSADPTFIPFLHPAAIQFVSKKVASQTGDLRKAFDICHRAITLIESETKASAARLRLTQSDTISPSKTQSTPLTENPNLCSPTPAATPLKQAKLNLTSTLGHLTPSTAPRASIAHMAKITAQVFSNGTSQRLSHLNMQQKAVLCTLASYEKKKRDADAAASASPFAPIFSTPSKRAAADAAPTIKRLYESYTALCRRENLLHPLTGGEFRDVVAGLETLSLVQAVEGRGGAGGFAPVTPSRTPGRRGRGTSGFSAAVVGDERRMGACVGFGELRESLQGPGSEILREMLEGGFA